MAVYYLAQHGRTYELLSPPESERLRVEHITGIGGYVLEVPGPVRPWCSGVLLCGERKDADVYVLGVQPGDGRRTHRCAVVVKKPPARLSEGMTIVWIDPWDHIKVGRALGKPTASGWLRVAAYGEDYAIRASEVVHSV